MSRRRVVTEPDQREWLRRNVRARRLALGLTMAEASARGKMSLRHWQKVEAGEANVTLTTLVKLSHALNIDIGELLRVP